MARVVGGVGAPHTPHFPVLVQQATPLGLEVERLYREVRERLEAFQPDLLVFFTSDHYNVFFVESIPIFSIGVAESSHGPSDYPNLPSYDVPLAAELARPLQARLVEMGFDVGMSQEFEFDHPVTVPLGFLAPNMDIPVLPIFINGLIPPLPTAARCFELGRAIRTALEEQADDSRVVAIASGSFSLEIGGPRISQDSHTGVPDPAWMQHVLEQLEKGEVDELVEDATTEQLTKAGNAGASSSTGWPCSGWSTRVLLLFSRPNRPWATPTGPGARRSRPGGRGGEHLRRQ